MEAEAAASAWPRLATAAAELLEAIEADRGRLLELDVALRQRLLSAAGRVARPTFEDRKRLAKARRRKGRDKRRAEDEAKLEQTGIRLARAEAVFQTPFRPAPKALPLYRGSSEPAEQVEDARNCYVCKADYHRLHFFYDQLCPSCAERNWEKRFQTADLAGRTALVTGARVKIGFQAAIKLLRAGSRVIVLTRFPRDAARRYASEPDFEDWRHRLAIYGIDLRHTPSVETLCRHLLAEEQRLDFLINNACQTVRRPAGFYQHLLDAEAGPVAQLPAAERELVADYEAFRGGRLRELLPDDGSETAALRAAPSSVLEQATGLVHAAALSQLPLTEEDLERDPSVFPDGRLDADLQQVDLRDKNSWRLSLAEVPAVELLEVHLVNAVAPFILNARLKPLMTRIPSRDKHIVNVSAMEGQFYRAFKTDKHPHTNMAKAALNMLTRTSALDYVKSGIHMNAVDTGWVTDEDPAAIAERKREEHRFHPPLDIVDGAARILDPIFHGLNTGEHAWGLFLKDYAVADW
ncbi:MAG: SDR family oxidoreductase [Caldilineae bacterium]|nr:SDR family oxidoreductase [Chloroflexota bacterium]MCB9175597.1 SDR family oxidoreductase [Caldilineae bacterium]